MNNKTVDILAPAGSPAQMRAAVFAGANSIYLGAAGFNARRTAENFGPDDLSDAVAFCHARGVKVNVAVNTVVSDAELSGLADTLRSVAQSGADAVILQDLAAARLCSEIAPTLARHASTQMSVTNLSGAKLLAKNGFTRVILARELTSAEIAHITKHCGIETEIFIHGAHCMCVSGQCYMSAFFGGRSGNRGACAGPCRLPYTANGDTGPWLSLRDLSLIDRMQQIAQMGVACVKIEGRLRTPEYVAAAVNATRRALQGEQYNADLLEKAFSRAGFTSGFFDNDYLTKSMFGQRTEADGAQTKAALPALRELFRRENQSVGVKMEFTLTESEALLRVSDGKNTVTAGQEIVCQPARTEQKDALHKSLSKCGGTPFYAQEIRLQLTQALYCPASVVNELRRAALEQLLTLREKTVPHQTSEPLPLPLRRTQKATGLQLAARFATAKGLSAEVCDRLAWFSLPLREAANIAHPFRQKAVLSLPRLIFNDEKTKEQLLAAYKLGYMRYEAQSICSLALIQEVLPNADITAGFGCNVTNTLSAVEYEKLGAKEIVLSPELSLENANRIGGSVPKAVLAYGHLPLMLVRACPLKNVTDCATCKGEGSLIDRKGETLAVECTGTGEGGYRELLNPIPLWLGDRKREIGCETALLYFTRESSEKIAAVVEDFAQGNAFEGDFTRGLLYKSVF